MIRRLLSLAPLPPVVALSAFATGVGLWLLAVVTPRPVWAPDWSGWALTVVGWVLMVRGLVGLSGIVDVVRHILRPTGWPGKRTPRSEEEIADLLAQRRRDGWEYYLTAAYLRLGRERVEPQYLDHQLQYRPPVAERVADEEFKDFIQDALDDVVRIIENANSTFGSPLQEKAFGPPGTPGDPASIKHYADRLTGFYEGLIAWAARLRGVRINPDLRTVLDLTTRLVDASVESYRTFVDDFVAMADGPMTETIRTRGRLEMAITLEITVDEQISDAISKEIDRLVRAGW